MAISAKGLRHLSVAGGAFHWKVRKKISWDELHDDQVCIPIQHVSGGQLLVAYIGYARSIYGAISKHTIFPINPKVIEQYILEAINMGWQYKTPGKPVSIIEGKLTTDTRVAKWKVR